MLCHWEAGAVEPYASDRDAESGGRPLERLVERCLEELQRRGRHLEVVRAAAGCHLLGVYCGGFGEENRAERTGQHVRVNAMKTWIEGVLKAQEIRVSVLLALCVVLGLLAFNPFDLSEKLGLEPVVGTVRPFIGLGWLLAVGFTVAQIGAWIVRAMGEKRKGGIADRRALEALNSVDPKERSLLREFSLQGQHTIELPAEEPLVAGLVHKGVLVQVGYLGEASYLGWFCSYMVRPALAKKLTKKFLHLPNRKWSQKDHKRIGSERPVFVVNRIDFLKMVGRM